MNFAPTMRPQRWLLPADIASGCLAASHGTQLPPSSSAEQRRPAETGRQRGGAVACTALPEALLRRRFWKGTGSASSRWWRAHHRPPRPRWPPPVSSPANCADALPPPHFSSYQFYRVDGHPSPPLLYLILSPMHFFYLSNVPPCPPLVPAAGRAWPGLCPAQKLSADASVTVSIKTKLLCALTKKTY